MRIRIIRTIVYKQLLEVLRDKKTLFMSILMPLLLYPVLMLGITQLMMLVSNDLTAQEIYYASSAPLPPAFAQAIERSNQTLEDDTGKLVEVPVSDYRAALQDRTLDTYIEVGGTAEQPVYTIYTHSARDKGSFARTRLREVLDDCRKALVTQTLTANGLDAEAVQNPFTLDYADTAENEEVAGSLLGQVLPILLIVGLLMGAIYPAIDAVAGEKERGTLETLFTLPVSGLELVMGKYIAVAICALVTTLLNVLSMSLTMAYLFMSISAVPGEEAGLMAGFDFGKMALPMLLTILCLCLVALIVSAVSICICSFARSYKDAQNYATPLMLLVMLPCYITMLPTTELTAGSAAIPIVNVALLIKGVFLFQIDWGLMTVVLISNLVYSMLSILLLARVFRSEDVLFGSGKNLLLLERRADLPRGGLPGVSDGLVLYSAGVLSLIYLSSAFQAAFGLGMSSLVFNEALIVGLPLLFAWYIKADLKKLLPLRLPSLRVAVGGMLMIAGAHLVAMLVNNSLFQLFPQLGDLVEGLNTAIVIDTLWLNLLVVGLLPGLCEEIFFRGFLFTAFGGQHGRAVSAIVFTAVLFGLFHMNILQAVTGLVLGLVLGYTRHRSAGLLLPMALHALNNGWAVLVSHLPADSAPAQFYEKPLVMLIAAPLLLAAGWLIARDTKKQISV